MDNNELEKIEERKKYEREMTELNERKRLEEAKRKNEEFIQHQEEERKRAEAERMRQKAMADAMRNAANFSGAGTSISRSNVPDIAPTKNEPVSGGTYIPTNTSQENAASGQKLNQSYGPTDTSISSSSEGYEEALRATALRLKKLSFEAEKEIVRSLDNMSGIRETDAGHSAYSIYKGASFAYSMISTLNSDSNAKRITQKLGAEMGNKIDFRDISGLRKINDSLDKKAADYNITEHKRFSGIDVEHRRFSDDRRFANSDASPFNSRDIKRLQQGLKNGTITGAQAVDASRYISGQNAFKNAKNAGKNAGKTVTAFNGRVSKLYNQTDTYQGLMTAKKTVRVAKSAVSIARMGLGVVGGVGRGAYLIGRGIVALGDNSYNLGLRAVNKVDGYKTRAADLNPIRKGTERLKKKAVDKLRNSKIGRGFDKLRNSKFVKGINKVTGKIGVFGKGVGKLFGKINALKNKINIIKVKIIFIGIILFLIIAAFSLLVNSASVLTATVYGFFYDVLFDDSYVITSVLKVQGLDPNIISGNNYNVSENIYNVLSTLNQNTYDKIVKAAETPSIANNNKPVYGFLDPNTGTNHEIDHWGILTQEECAERNRIDGYNCVYVDGDGNETTKISNTKEIMSMAHAFMQVDYDNYKAYLCYAIQLWNDSHEVEYEMSDTYECDSDVCKHGISYSYKCEDASALSAASGAHVKYGSKAVFDEDGCCIGGEHPGSLCSDIGHCDNIVDRGKHNGIGCNHGHYESYTYEVEEDGKMVEKEDQYWICDGHCGGHTANLCCGHVDLDVTMHVTGLEEENNLFKVDSVTNEFVKTPGVSSPISHIIVKPKKAIVKGATESIATSGQESFVQVDLNGNERIRWDGWCPANVDLMHVVYDDEWDKSYGVTITEGMGLSLQETKKSYIMDELLKKYPGLSEERQNIIKYALDSVGKIPYYFGGAASGPGYDQTLYDVSNFGVPTTPDRYGHTITGMDCKRWACWVYWSVIGNNIGNGSDEPGKKFVGGTPINRLDMLPGDLMQYSEGVGHVAMFLYWGDDGEMMIINETGTFSNVLVGKGTNLPWKDYYRFIN